MKQSSISFYKMLLNKTYIQNLQKSAFIKNSGVNEFVSLRIYFIYIKYELFYKCILYSQVVKNYQDGSVLIQCTYCY